MERLISLGSLTEEAAQFLKRLVRAKYNIFISGGTGAGKTTFLNALSDFIPKGERIITIEDNAELQIQGVENLVRLEAREPNLEGEGAVTIRDLIRSALRMRPDRIIVGEVRGEETVDMISSAMLNGHSGSMSTGHANSAEDMLHRLETMMMMGIDLPLPGNPEADCFCAGCHYPSRETERPVKKSDSDRRGRRNGKRESLHESAL